MDSPSEIHELRASIADVKNDIANVKGDVAEVKADVRVSKHDVANLQMALSGFSGRFDKFQESIGGKLDALGDKFNTMNNQQARGLGFFAGAAFILTACGAMLIGLGKLIFGAHV